MRVITLNVNGIRSAERKGFARWLARVEPWDVVCLQEIKCLECDVPATLRAPRKSVATFHPAERKGYSGVAIYSKLPHAHSTGFGHPEFDAEGRYVEANFGNVTVISVYLPSGSSGPHRQASKFRFLDAFLPHLHEANVSQLLDKQNLSNIAIVEQPVVEQIAASPQRGIIVALGFLWSLAFATGIAVVLDLMNGTVCAPFELEAATGVMLLAVLPRNAQNYSSVDCSGAISGNATQPASFNGSRHESHLES